MPGKGDGPGWAQDGEDRAQPKGKAKGWEKGGFRGMIGEVPSHAASAAWRDRQKETHWTEPDAPPAPKHPAVVAMAEVIAHYPVVRMYVNEMMDEVWWKDRKVDSVGELLAHVDAIMDTAPEWETDKEKRVFFPFSALFNDMMMTTSGAALFRNAPFNDALRVVLKAWCRYLDSPDSRYVLNKGDHGWLCDAAWDYNALDSYVIPDPDRDDGGFASFNAYFHREIKADRRPMPGRDDPKAITAANDGAVYRIARDVKETDTFWIKAEPYSIRDMLAGSPHTGRFVGGDVYQSYLSGADYHRWHAPIAGTVREVRTVDGLMFSNLESMGEDIKGVKSQAYYTSLNTRGLTFIESDDPVIGMICIVAVGITEVSSVAMVREDRTPLKPGDRVAKGEEVGRFSYGGSSIAVAFQKGAIADFTKKSPRDPEKDIIKVEVNDTIARAR